MHSGTRFSVSQLESASPEAYLRVLIVEDDDADAELIERMLANGDGARHHGVARVATLRAALDRLQGDAVDVMLLDLGLPDAIGLSGLQCVVEARPTLPVLVVTGSGERETGLRAVALGAQDYLAKDQLTTVTLAKSLRYAVERARAANVEMQLLEQTLHGSIKILTTVLSLVSPTSFGRAERLKEYVSAAARELRMPQRWMVEVAAMVSQLGWIEGAPDESGPIPGAKRSAPERRRLSDSMPAIAAELFRNIPHLEGVRQILTLQTARKMSRSIDPEVAYDSHVQIGAELLFIAAEFDALEEELGSRALALRHFRELSARFEPRAFEAFLDTQMRAIEGSTNIELRVAELLPDMVLTADVLTTDGRLVVAHGNRVTSTMLVRLRYFAQRGQIAEPVRVERLRETASLIGAPAS
ncbi:MAG: response regulator [Planctomycetes bacterium]|nr:response regulator [Planctomycetota bacterium]